MANLKHVWTILASWAGAATSLFVLAGALYAAANHQLGSVSLLFVAYAAAAAAVLLPVVLSKLDDHETLSVYRHMRARRLIAHR